MNEFARWRELIAAAQKRGNPYVPYEPDGADVLAMMDEIERLRAAPNCNWDSLQCRFGCADPVVGIYHAPHGCICWPDRLQALCAQHAIKGLRNNDMSVLIKRP